MEAVELFQRLGRGGSGGIERAGRAAALLVAELTRRGATLGAQTDSCPSGDDQLWLLGRGSPPPNPVSYSLADRSGRTSGPGGNERPVRLVC